MPTSKRVHIFWYDDWVAVFVDGKEQYQDHDLGSYTLLELAAKHNFSIDDVVAGWADNADWCTYLELYGCFPDTMDKMPNYEITFNAII